jgi:hypothetical protein
MNYSDSFLTELENAQKGIFGEWTINRSKKSLEFSRYAYWIPIEDLSNHKGIVKWMFHLNEKDWFSGSVIKDFIRACEHLCQESPYY